MIFISRTMLSLKFCLIFTLISSTFSSLDSSHHSDKLLNMSKRGSSREIFTWAALDERLKMFADSLLLPHIKGLFKLQKESGVSSDCGESLYAFMMGLRNRKRWAFEMADATGKIPAGLLDGTVMDFGSFDECLRIRVNDTSKYGGNKELFRGRFCMVGFHTPLMWPMGEKRSDGKTYVEAYGNPPEWASDIVIKADGYLKRVALWFGACVPSTCTEDDILKISTQVSKPLGFKVMVKDCQIDEPYVWPAYSVASVSVLGSLVALCVVGTLVDVISRWRKSNPTNNEDDHILLRVPKAFSFLANTESLLRGSAGGGSLTCFNGIRFLSATWIVLGHQYFYVDTWKYIKYRRLIGFVYQFNRYFPAAVIENFTIPVGSFFFMSGFLLVYTTWRLLEKNKGKFNLLVFIIHKFWRMTPALGLMLILFFCMPLIDSGPVWNSTLNPPLEQCRKFWWKNILYINNWWNTDEFCLIHTWYLAALMQFHIVGILLLLIVYRWPVLGVLLGSFITVSCAAVTAYLVIYHDIPMPAPGIIKDMDVIEDYNSRIYIKPFAHFTTYLIGMIMAYIILKYHKKKMAPKYQVIGWTLATISALSSVYGLYGPADSPVVRALYIVGHRIGWALSIGWMVYACASGNGGIVNRILSWNALAPLGQLSYLTYLLHPLVITYRNAALRERVYNGHTEVVFTFLSTLVVSIFLAFVGYVAVETPFAILEKMVFSNRSKLNFKKMDYKDDPQITARGIKTVDP